METQQTPTPIETDATAGPDAEAKPGAQTTSEPGAQANAEDDFVPMHEDDYICEELSEEFGETVWICKPTGRPYFQHNDPIRSWAKLPVLDHDDPFLKFLRGEINY